VRTLSLPLVCLSLLVLMTGCASRPLPKFQKPIKRAQFQTVRTTAYTHTESDHRAYGCRSALGNTLSASGVHSAAADWSRWPAGTTFRIAETGELFRVDDYGWALAGTNTIDLYKPTRSAMNAWGVRKVNIENLQWGDPHRSLTVLKSRSKYRHIKRMVKEYDKYGMKFPPLPQSN
jgi:3D (Asp-Asp-Asp) domain-containing protein